MKERRILLAMADPAAGEEFREGLGKRWIVTVVANGTAALAAMRQESYDVVVADWDLPETDGASLLQQVRKKNPETIRFIVAPEEERNQVMKKVLGGAHQFLTKPLDKAALKSALEQAAGQDIWIPNAKIRELAGRIRVFPTAPELYFEIINLLKSPDATTQEVGDLIAKDMAMMTKLLQVLNSAYFGLPRRITEPADAVAVLGFEAVKSMVTAVKLLSQYERVRPAYFSIDQLWTHSLEVAQTAKQLTEMTMKDRGLAASAYTAGLLHDLGKVVLAANFDEQYGGAHSLARKLQVPICQIEKEVFGASHGEIGAYLFALWGMPPELLEAVALHHDPSGAGSDTFTPLTAVHVADAFQHELHPDAEGLGTARVDEAYLQAIGYQDHLAVWRAAVITTDSANAESEVKTSESVTVSLAPVAEVQPDVSAPVPELPEPNPEPAALVPVQESRPSPEEVALQALASETANPVPRLETCLPPKTARPSRPAPWLYAAAAAAVLLLLVTWMMGGFGTSQPQPVRARSIPRSSIPAPAPSPAKEEATADKPSQPASSPTAAKEPSSALASAPTHSTPTQAVVATPSIIRQAPTNKPIESALEQTKKAAAAPSVTSSMTSAVPAVATAPAPAAQPTKTPPVEPTFANLKVQGIFYSPTSPSAIVNGKLVRVRDQVAGATVVDIKPAEVTLEIGTQRKSLTVGEQAAAAERTTASHKQ